MVDMSRLIAVSTAFALTLTGSAESPREADPPAVVLLNHEVAALQTLYALDASKAQLEALRKIASETAATPPKGVQVKVSDAYRKKLHALREALVDATNEEEIGKLSDQLDKLRDAEKPDLGDDVDITDAAVERAPEVLRMLTAGQVAGFVGSMAQDIVDPREHS